MAGPSATGTMDGFFGINAWARHRADTVSLGGKLLRSPVQFGTQLSGSVSVYQDWWFGYTQTHALAITSAAVSVLGCPSLSIVGEPGAGTQNGFFGINAWARHRTDTVSLGGRFLRKPIQFGGNTSNSVSANAYQYWWFGTINAFAYTLTSTTGQYAETGSGLTSKAARRLSQTSGQYAETGYGLTFGFSKTFTSGSYTETGSSLIANAARKFSQTTAQYAETGSGLTSQIARKLPQTTAQYAENGSSATAKAARTIAVLSGAYLGSGSGGKFSYGNFLAGSTGQYAETGSGLTANVARKLSQIAGQYTETGSPLTRTLARYFPSASASYSYSGSALAAKVARKLSSTSGQYTETGSGITFTVVAGVSYTLSCFTAQYAEIGSGLTSQIARKLPQTTAQYAETGSLSVLRVARKLSQITGEYAENGSGAIFDVLVTLSANSLTVRRPIFSTPALVANDISIETKIYTILSNRLTIFAADPIAIAYPGIAFQPIGGQPYLKISFLPARTFAFGINDTDDYRGIFQVDVFWPAQQGEIAPSEMAEAIVANFARGTVFYEDGAVVNINDPPYTGPALQEPGWLRIPVTIRYRAFA